MLQKYYNNYKKNYTLFLKQKKISSAKSKIKLYNSVVKCAHILLKVNHHKNFMSWFGVLIMLDPYNIVKNKVFFKSYTHEYQLKYLLNFIFPFTKYRVIFYKTKMPYEDFFTAPIHNKVVVIYKEKDGYGFYKSIKWNFLSKNKSQFKSSSIKKIKNINSAIYVRQSSANTLFITNRVINDTDYFDKQIKINLAYYLSKLISKRIIMMYEKDSNKYEESASVLYEKLIDKGYKNVYYVINKNSAHVVNIKPKYRKHILWKNSFKHYLMFFLTKSFIGTEAPAHSISLRIRNKHAEQKINKKNYDCVFLQHGVMYMVSLASETRKSFRKGNLMPEHAKIVVSSELEKMHFIEDGEYEENDLYVTGLPKFDRNYRYENANKIVIMPTWRPWEYNQIRADVKSTNYYKMLIEIMDSVPENLKDKVIVLPHPLFLEAIEDDFPIKLPNIVTYDEILRDCAVLITDYSSIVTDAFFRGANVIFWWKEKEECMREYQGHLMLNEKNIYGPICYNSKELTKAINDSYNKPQKEKYVNNFNKIVEFHDFNNTNRLIELLIKDKIIDEVKKND